MPEALGTGLVDRVVPADDVRAAAEQFAEQLADQPRAALRAIKRTMRSELRTSFARAIEREQDVQRSLYESEDFQRETGGGYRYRPDD